MAASGKSSNYQSPYISYCFICSKLAPRLVSFVEGLSMKAAPLSNQASMALVATTSCPIHHVGDFLQFLWLGSGAKHLPWCLKFGLLHHPWRSARWLTGLGLSPGDAKLSPAPCVTCQEPPSRQDFKPQQHQQAVQRCRHQGF